jgi:hypothetical protein
MATKQKTYLTAQKYIDSVNNEAREIELLENLLREKHKNIEKTLANLRSYKKRGIVKQISKYNYEIVKGE